MGAATGESRPWLWLVVSVLSMTGGAVWLGTYPSALVEQRRYERASSCAPDSRSTDDCWQVVPATVLRTYTTGRRSTSFKIRLELGPDAGAAAGVTHVEVLGPRPVWQALRPGQQVDARLWHGRVVRITAADTGAVETTESPRLEAPIGLVMSLVCISWGGFGLFAAFQLRRLSGSWRRKADTSTAMETGPSRPRVILSASMLASGVAVFMVTYFDVTRLGAIGVVSALAGGGVLLLAARRGVARKVRPRRKTGELEESG